MIKNDSKKVTLGAMITVISIILLYCMSIFPTIKIFLISLVSFLISIMVLEVGIRTALLCYVSTSILSLLLIPNKLILIPYVVFFGNYALVKYYIEKLNKMALEWLLKLILFNIAIFIKYIIFTSFINKDIKLPVSLWLVFLALQVIFIIYDYMFSMFIDYYRNKIGKHIY